MPREVTQPRKKLWEPTSVTYLFRYIPTGEYVMRRRRGKSDERVYLGTNLISVAKWKIPEVLKGWRQKAVKCAQTVSELSEEWISTKEADPSLKARTKTYQRDRLAALMRSWPELATLRPPEVKEADVSRWASDYATRFSPSNYNHVLSILRDVFNLAVEKSIISSNPVLRIKRKRETSKSLRLPDAGQFQRLVAAIRSSGSGSAAGCGDLVEFLAFSGLRVHSEAAHVTWGDIDLNGGRMTVRGEPGVGTKNREERTIPIIPELRALLVRLSARRRNGEQRPVRVKSCYVALSAACSKIGIPNLTHHDLRHIFASRCLASGVDVPTVAQWLGHKDGGALLLKTYSHVLQSHSFEMAKRVSVGSNNLPDKADHQAASPAKEQGLASTQLPSSGLGVAQDHNERNQADEERPKHEANKLSELVAHNTSI